MWCSFDAWWEIRDHLSVHLGMQGSQIPRKQLGQKSNTWRRKLSSWKRSCCASSSTALWTCRLAVVSKHETKRKPSRPLPTLAVGCKVKCKKLHSFPGQNLIHFVSQALLNHIDESSRKVRLVFIDFAAFSTNPDDIKTFMRWVWKIAFQSFLLMIFPYKAITKTLLNSPSTWDTRLTFFAARPQARKNLVRFRCRSKSVQRSLWIIPSPNIKFTSPCFFLYRTLTIPPIFPLQ